MKTLCVFCGSSFGNQNIYREKAVELGKLLAQEKIRLIYGGGKVGLMGAIADSVLREGGEAIGVIPQFLLDKEVGHQYLTELIVVESMHERKKIMSDLAEGFVIMPGGIGTFEEFFEVLTWAQLRLHQKPIGILNVEGYYGLLLNFIHHTVKEGFLSASSQNLIQIEAEPAQLLERLKQIHSETDWQSGLI
jgi:uncharacterized protein (TIGR00730 family)